jgi:hypothetical protein
MAKLTIEVPDGLIWLLNGEEKVKGYLEFTLRDVFEKVLERADKRTLEKLRARAKGEVPT